MIIPSTRVLPYVYILTHRETKQFYIGYRCANKLPSSSDLPRYQSSSKAVKRMGFENFDFQIIAEFFEDNDAYDFENQLIAENCTNPLILNRSYWRKDKGHLRFKAPTAHTDETKELISKRLRELMTDEFKQMMSAVHKNKITSDETKAKIALTKTGKPLPPFSEEHRAKMAKARSAVNANSKWWTDGVVSKFTAECPGDGWSRGRAKR